MAATQQVTGACCGQAGRAGRQAGGRQTGKRRAQQHRCSGPSCAHRCHTFPRFRCISLRFSSETASRISGSFSASCTGGRRRIHRRVGNGKARVGARVRVREARSSPRRATRDPVRCAMHPGKEGSKSSDATSRDVHVWVPMHAEWRAPTPFTPQNSSLHPPTFSGMRMVKAGRSMMDSKETSTSSMMITGMQLQQKKMAQQQRNKIGPQPTGQGPLQQRQPHSPLGSMVESGSSRSMIDG